MKSEVSGAEIVLMIRHAEKKNTEKDAQPSSSKSTTDIRYYTISKYGRHVLNVTSDEDAAQAFQDRVRATEKAGNMNTPYRVVKVTREVLVQNPNYSKA